MSLPAGLSAEVDPQLIESPPVAEAGKSWPRRLVLAGIVTAAAAVRIPGVLWGLPTELHPDEPVITNNAIDLVHRNSITPHVFDRPDHLEILLSSFAYRIFAWLAASTSATADFAAHPSHYLAISRCITVAFSLVAIPLAWCIGRRFGTVTAVAAALLIAFFPPFVANSSYATPDMPLTCLMLAAILASMRYLERPTVVRLAIASAAVGVGVTIKYPAAIAGAIVGTVVVTVMVRSRDWRRGVRHVLLSPVFFLGTVFVVSHALITDFSAVRYQLQHQRGSDHLGAEALGWPGNLAYYAKDYASWAGIVLLALTAVGVWYCVRERAVHALPLLLGVVYWIALSTVPAHWERWALPMFLAPLLFAAVGAGEVARWTQVAWRRGSLRPRLRIAVPATILVALAALQLFAGSALVAAGFAGSDTRLAARSAFRAAGVDQYSAIYDGYTPIAPGGPGSISVNVKIADGQLYIVGRSGARFVVTSSTMYGRYTRARYPAIWLVYQQVRGQMPVLQQWTPVAVPSPSIFEPFAIVRDVRYVYRVAQGGDTGPTMAVYEIPPSVPFR